MSDLNLRKLTGWFGVASGALLVVVIGLYFAVGTTPRAEDAAAFSDYVSKHSSLLLSLMLAATLSSACFIVFLAGVRHLIQQAKPDYEWSSHLVFGAGLVSSLLGLVGFTFISSAALDTINHKADPSVVSALGEGSTPAFGAIGLIMLALFLASAGYATSGTGVLPRWTRWVAYATAILALIAAPAIYAGSGPTTFYSADGYVLFLGELGYTAWLLIAGISMLALKPAMK